MDRRDFLKYAAATAAAAALAGKITGWRRSAARAGDDAVSPPADNRGNKVVVVRKGSPEVMFRKGIEAFGGMGAWVGRGRSVVVKPNIGWDRTPEEGANTHPGLVAEIVRQALAAGASRVDVFDHTCNEWRACYANSGIQAAVEAAGGRVLPAHLESHYVEMERPAAAILKKAKIHKAVLDADVFINVPILKNHGGAKMTGVMKNHMGLIWDRQFMHRNNLPQCIADLWLYRRPDLNVLDAHKIMVANGPRGVSTADVRDMNYQLLGRDPVAMDALAARLMNYGVDDVAYLALAEKQGHGAIEGAEVVRLEA